ncbi:MAG: proline dehydrogenase family protein [Gemmatimonadota bacterium]
MLRQSLLYLSDNRTMRRAVRETPLSRRLAQRFVAGDTLDDAVRIASQLNADGFTFSLDYLGELVISRAEALSAADMAIRSLERIAADGLHGNISVKPSQLGLEIEESFCVENLSRILFRARALEGGTDGIFVRLDMEGSDYTERTIRLVETLWHLGFRNVGTVVQSYLHRTPDDVRRLNGLGARVRLVKGAYREPSSIAYQEMPEVQRMFAEEMKMLLDEGNYPAIATHDEELIAATRRYAFEHGIARESFEFQMLYGIRRDLQQRLREEGYRVRIYLPYGESWYPYLMRRLAERPANVLFVAGNLLRESPLSAASRPIAIGSGVVTGALVALAWRGRNNG